MEWLKLIVVSGAILVMVGGTFFVLQRLKEKQQGFGPNSLRAMGIVLFLPILLILAVMTNFQTETLAALLVRKHPGGQTYAIDKTRILDRETPWGSDLRN